MRLVLGLLLGACGSGGGFPDANIIDSPPETGAFSLAWTVTDANQQPISCDRIGAVALTVLDRALVDFPGARELAYGAALLVVFLEFPAGLAGLWRRRTRK